MTNYLPREQRLSIQFHLTIKDAHHLEELLLNHDSLVSKRIAKEIAVALQLNDLQNQKILKAYPPITKEEN